MDLQRFVSKFGFKVVNVKHHNPYRYIDRYDSFSQSYYTKPEIDTTIEMEIGQRELEHMADYFDKTEKMLNEERDEYYLRRDNPGLKEAYDKYRMLLELYK